MYRETKTEGEAITAQATPISGQIGQDQIGNKQVRGPSTTVDAVGRILLDAAALQKQHGLCDKSWSDLSGHICPRYAIKLASPDPIACYKAEQQLQRYLGCRLDMWVIGRTLEEVISAMRAAAR